MADGAFRKDPLIAANYFLQTGSETIATFSSVDGVISESEVVEHKQSGKDGKQVIIKTVGANKLKAGEFTAKFAAAPGTNAIMTWRKQVVDGDMVQARRNVSLVLYTVDGKEALRANVVQAWPSKLKMSSLATKSNEAVQYEVTIVHEGLEFVGGPQA